MANKEVMVSILKRQLERTIQDGRLLDLLVILSRLYRLNGIDSPILESIRELALPISFEDTDEICSAARNQHWLNKFQSFLKNQTSLYFHHTDVLLQYFAFLLNVCADDDVYEHLIRYFSSTFNHWTSAHFVSVNIFVDELFTELSTCSLAGKRALFTQFKLLPQFPFLTEISNGRAYPHSQLPAPLWSCSDVIVDLLKFCGVPVNKLEPTAIHDSYYETASTIKVNAIEHKLIRESEESNVYEILADIKLVSANNCPGAKHLKALIYLLTSEIDENFPPTMLLTATSWEAIFQQIYLDRERSAEDDQLYWNENIVALIFDPIEFAQQQLERFKLHGHVSCPC